MKFALPFFLVCSNILAQKSSISLFQPVVGIARSTTESSLNEHITQYTLLQPDQTVWSNLLAQRPQSLTLSLPFEGGLTLKLEKTNPLAHDFILTASNAAGGTDTLDYDPGLHYSGKIVGEAHSLVAISIFADQIMGVISDASSNINLGRVNTDAAKAANTYVIYRDIDLVKQPEFRCDSKEDAIGEILNLPKSLEKGQILPSCPVRIYLDCDYNLYTANGSNVTTTTNLVIANFNIVKTIYANENIPIEVSQTHVWTTNDPFPNTDSGVQLDALKTYYTNNSLNGHFACLLVPEPWGRGWQGAFCNTPYSNNVSGWMVNPNPFPTYSQSAATIAHELGHNFGTPHTHSCTWPGGAIDNCAAVEDGTCNPGPPPANGGTIMSYCQLKTPYSLANGFGPLPGNLIRNNYQNATCVNTPPNTNFSFNVNGQSVSFTNTSSGGTSYLWDFGNGQTSTQTNPSHIYTTTGKFEVCLTVTGQCAVSTKCLTVNIPENDCWHWPSTPYIEGKFQDLFFVNANVGWAVGEGGTIMKTENAGTNWTIQNSNANVTLRSVHFLNAQYGFVVGDNGTILKTINGGASWMVRNANTTKILAKVQIMNSGVIYIRQNDLLNLGNVYNSKILKSIDAGLTWQTLAVSSIFDFHFPSINVGYAIQGLDNYGYNIWKTSNAGLTWDRIYTIPDGSYTGLFFLSNSLGWVTTANGKIYKTEDAGATWIEQNSNTTTRLLQIQFINNQVGFAHSAGLDCDDEVQIYTTNGGNIWSLVPTKNVGACIGRYPLRKLQITNNDSGFAIFGSNLDDSPSLMKIINFPTANMSFNTAPYYSHRAKSFCFKTPQKGWIASGDDFDDPILKTTDGGKNWLEVKTPGLYASWDVFFQDTLLGWVCGKDGNQGRICFTTDGGYKWSLSTVPVVSTVNSIYFINKQIGWAATTTGQVLKSMDGGINWTLADKPTVQILNDIYFFNDQIGWVVGSAGVVFKTTNGGGSWTPQTSNTTDDLASAFFMNDQTGWVVGENGTVLKTTNGGANWAKQTSNTTNFLKSVYFLNAQLGYIVGTNGTILKTINGGSNWIRQHLSGTINDLVGVQFIDNQNGWILGEHHTLLKFGSPGKPVVQNKIYCKNAAAQPLTATGTNLLWYTSPTGGIGSTTAPTPNTAVVGTTTYYVSQSLSGFGNCTESERAAITVTVTAPPTISVSSTNSCNTNGSATVTATGGTPPYTYKWSNNQTTATATNLASGTYTVTVTSANGCTATATATVNSLPGGIDCGLVARYKFNNATQDESTNSNHVTAPNGITYSDDKFGNCKQSVRFNGTNQYLSAPSSPSLESPTGSITLMGWAKSALSTAGLYSLISKVVPGTSTLHYRLGIGPDKKMFFGFNGNSDRTTTITDPNFLITNWNHYAVSWDGSNARFYLNGVKVGNDIAYSGIIQPTPTAPLEIGRDAHGPIEYLNGNLDEIRIYNRALSVSEIQQVVNLTGDTPLSANIATPTSVCSGQSNGSATVTATGGTTPYTYKWTNNQTTATAANLAAGTYTVTVTGNNSCTATATATVGVAPAPTVTIANPTPACAGQTNGSATVTATGGGTPYTYQWSNNQTTATATNLAAGTYTVTVKGNNGCAATTTATIVTANGPVVSAATSLTCVGQSNGTATAIASGGTTPYTYQWNNNQTTATIANLAAGTYTVTVKGNNGCTTTATATVNTINPPVATANPTAACAGQANGSIGIYFSSGVPPYQYNWSNGQTVNPAVNLTAGPYTVTITGNNGCSTTLSAIVPLSQTIVQLAAPDGPSTGIQGNTATYSIPAVPGAERYVWLPPPGCNINGGVPGQIVTLPAASGTSINLTYGCGWGELGVIAEGSCIQKTSNSKNLLYFTGTYKGRSLCLDAQAAENFDEACIAVSLNNVTGSNRFFSGDDPPNNFCGNIVQSDLWYAFVATQDSMLFYVNTTDCVNGDGVQLALVDGNKNQLACYFGAVQGADTTATIYYNDFIPGEVYYLYMDSYGGDACNYTIEVNDGNGYSLPPLAPLQALQGSKSACPKGSATYHVPQATNALQYIWTLPSGSTLNGDTGTVTLGPEGHTANIVFGSSSGKVCVAATNGCKTTAPVCVDVAVGNLPITMLPTVNVCHGNSYTTSWGQEISTSGTYQVMLTTSNGCDSVVQQTVNILPLIVTTLPHKVICKGEQVVVCGDVFSESTVAQAVCTSFKGCDSTVIFLITALDPVAEIAGNTVLCQGGHVELKAVVANSGPAPTFWKWLNANGQVIGNGTKTTITQPGVYILEASMSLQGVTCTVFDTTIVTLSNIAPPVLQVAGGIVSCASPTVVVGASSNVNASFEWSGPNGYVSNQAFNTVSVPGSYTVVATNANGCTSSATALVSLEDKTGTFQMSSNPATIGSIPAAVTNVSVPTLIQNKENHLINMLWERTFIDLTPGCTTGVEDKIATYSVSVGSGTFSLAPNEMAPLKVYLNDSDTSSCCGVVRLVCKNTCTLRDSLVVTYMAGCSVETKDAFQIRQLTISPNPGTGFFRVMGMLPAEGIGLRIFSIDGRLLFYKHLSVIPEFSLEGLPSGSYLAILENSAGEQVKAIEIILKTD